MSDLYQMKIYADNDEKAKAVIKYEMPDSSSSLHSRLFKK